MTASSSPSTGFTETKVYHRSARTGGRDSWTTPRELFDKLDEEFKFTVDGAADTSNHLCDIWFGPGSPYHEDALAVPWGNVDEVNYVYLNAPYSQNAAFVAKARAEADAGNALVVLLLPARTDTRWFHAFIWDEALDRPHPRTEIRFLRGRLKFGDGANSAPFPSMVVVFHPSEPFVFEDDLPWAAEGPGLEGAPV